MTFSLTYTAEAWGVLRGGGGRGIRALDNLDLTAEIDGENALGWNGATLFLYGLYNNGGDPSADLVGDIQTLSNIEAPNAVRLYEAWIDQRLLGEKLSLRLGLYDLNSEFDTSPARALFLNSSHGIGPDISQTGLNGPSIFPVTSLSLRAEYKLSDNWLVRAAVLDGVPGDPDRPRHTAIKLGDGDGALMISELNYLADGIKLGLGYWRYTARFENYRDARESRGNGGVYLLAERRLTRSVDGGLAAFARIGWADSSFNPIRRYVGAGAVYTGPFRARAQDQLGLAFGWVEFGQPYRRASQRLGRPVEPREVAAELTYRAPLNKWLTLQPSFQYVASPGGDPALRDAVVAGLRFQLGF